MTSYIMEHHQRNAAGNGKIIGHMTDHFRMPKDFPALVYLSLVGKEGLRQVASSLTAEGGDAAMKLRIAEAYVQQFGNLAKEGNTLVVPANLSDMSSMIALATSIIGNKPGS